MRTTYILIIAMLLSGLWAKATPGYTFIIKNTEGKALSGALVLTRYNYIVAVSDTVGAVTINNWPDVHMVHLLGYKDTLVAGKFENDDLILQHSKEVLAETTKPSLHKWAITSEYYTNSDFVISPVDTLMAGDTVIEKVTQINIKAAGILGVFNIRAGDWYHSNPQVFDFVIYTAKNGQPDSNLFCRPMPAVFLKNMMMFNLYDHQLKLEPGSYFVGYKKHLGPIIQNSKTLHYYERGFHDYKSSAGKPTYRKINNDKWIPVLMPKSKPDKIKYYSFVYSLQLVNTR